MNQDNPPEARPTDIWAMGITLFCWIFGIFPFEETTRVMVLYNRIANFELSFPDPHAISGHLKDFFVKILEKDPQKRITIPEMKVIKINL